MNDSVAALDTKEKLKLASSHIEKGHLSFADVLCRDILDHEPDHALAINLTGVIAAKAGLREQAIANFAHAAQLAPAYTPAQKNLAMAQSLPPPYSGWGKFLLIKAWGAGFWADVAQVLGNLLLAEITGRTPIVHWGSNSLYNNGNNRDAFSSFFSPISAVTIDMLPSLVGDSVFPPKWNAKNLAKENLNKSEGEWSRMTALSLVNRPETLVVSDYHVSVLELLPWISANHPMHGQPIDTVYRYLAERYLHPVSTIWKEIVDFFNAHIVGKPLIAVHARGSDEISEFAQMEFLNTLYFIHLDRQYQETHFFLLTEDANLLSAFEKRYPGRIISSNAQRTNNRIAPHFNPAYNRFGLGRDVMLDTYVAISCAKFIGAGISNVSCIIAALKDWKPDRCTLLSPSLLHDRFFGSHIYPPD